MGECGSGGDPAFELTLHLRPLVIQNAEVHRIPHPAVPRHQVLAESSFFPGADAKDGIARALIQRISFKFDTNALPNFKSVAQHQELGFGVDRGTLPRRCNPGGTDLRPAIHSVDVHEARTADYALR